MRKEATIATLVLAYLLMIWIVILLYGCSAAKDNRAVSRVIAKPDLSNKVFAILVKQHPCATDSVFLPGQEVVIYDTTHTEHTDTLVIDSVHQIVITKWRTNTVTKIVHKTDTIKKTSERAWGLCNDSLQTLRGRYAELQTQLAGEKKTSGKKTWWIVGLIVLIAGGIFLRFKKII